MSLIGKKPVAIPSGVTVQVEGDQVKVKGPKGELTQSFEPYYVAVEVDGTDVKVTAKAETRAHSARHGLYRSLISNMVEGCAKGFERQLEINGVGYTAKAGGPSKLTLNIGFCHPVEFEMPKGVTVETPSNTRIIIKGADKQAVGQIAANIRRVRPPEPYKGKGIKYAEEQIRRKAGKAVAGK
ncbi:MAG TPA: 50S ribosomal protein L6 [Planctomycetes bacterium]|nr:50S ribosomal protein L6 [Planctomycetota bacterium]